MFFFFKIYLFIFRERGREGERDGEKHPCVVASCTGRTWDLTHNPGKCPDWESNQRLFCLQAGTQSTEPHRPGLFYAGFNFNVTEVINSICSRYCLMHLGDNFS